MRFVTSDFRIRDLRFEMFRKRAREELTIESPDQALRVVSEIRDLTEQVRRVPGLEEGKVEEIERAEDRILREYSDMNPRRPTRFLRDLSDLATVIDSAKEHGVLAYGQLKLLELMVKKTKMRDFYAARKLLAKFSKTLEVKRERDAKLDAYRSYYRRMDARSRDLKAEIIRLRNVPMPETSPEGVAAVKKAFDEYNEAASAALVDFFAHTACAQAISFALEASRLDILRFPAPASPESVKDLLHVLEEEDVKKSFGGENIGRLVEASGFSEKRLEHFVKNYKWFQRRLQDNVGWLSELTAARSDALKILWTEPVESLRTKISDFEPYLRRLPRSERAIQTLSHVSELVQGGEYDVAMRSEAIYKAHGNYAAAKSRGTLVGEIEKLEEELTAIQKLMARLPPPDRMLAKGGS